VRKEQALAEVAFQRRDSARDGRLGQSEARGRPRKAAFVDDAGVEEEVVRLEFHNNCPKQREQSYPF
jgi:hypothetical protein